MKLYLYDARYNRKIETTYDEARRILSTNKACLQKCKDNMEKVKGRYYIIDDNTSKRDIKKLYSKEVFKNETWIPIEGSDNSFLISNYGRFKRIYKSCPQGKFVLPYFIFRSCNKNKNKQYVKVKFKGIYKEYNVARLVAYHFVDIYYEEYNSIRRTKDIKYKNYSYEDLIVYHKNGIVYDNCHTNLEWLDRDDLNKKLSNLSINGRSIIAIDANTGEIIDYYKSTRHAAKHLPVSKGAVHDSLSNKWKTNVVGGRYIFKYDD